MSSIIPKENSGTSTKVDNTRSQSIDLSSENKTITKVDRGQIQSTDFGSEIETSTRDDDGKNNQSMNLGSKIETITRDGNGQNQSISFGSGIETNTKIDNNYDHLIGFDFGISEIEEERLSEIFETNGGGVPLSTIKEEGTGSLFSFDFHNTGDVVYVAIGKSEETSMDALLWTLSHVVEPSSTVVFLIHIFPETKHVPTPLGMMAIDQVNPTQKESYLTQERGKRRDYLQKFMNVCTTSKVKADTILIESNMEGRAILDLVPILNIRRLVLGTSKRSIKARRVSGTAGQILKGVAEDCDVKIICEGKEMVDLIVESLSPRVGSGSLSFISSQELENVDNNAFSCGLCFKPKVGT